MLTYKNKRITSLLLVIALVLNIGCGMASVPVCAKSSVIIKQGCNYKLMKITTIYKGPGKDYGCVKRKNLKPSAKKYAVKDSQIAKFKKGTVVSCLKVKKKWMKIPSGWIHIEKNNLKQVKKHQA